MSRNKSEKGSSNLRSYPRIHSLREIFVDYEGFNEPVSSRPPDISTRGMFINTARKFPEGAVLNLRFRLDLTGAEIHTRCEVRYFLPGVGVGVEFVGISQESIRTIEREMKLHNNKRRPKGSEKRTQTRISRK
jgi:hypothetical protein